MKLYQTLVATVALLTLGASAAGATTVVVNGTSNPFLAGQSPGASIHNDPSGDFDVAPGESPVGIAVTPGHTFTVSNVTGTVSNCACTFYGPTGGPGANSGVGVTLSSPSWGTELVQPYFNLPLNSLVGVFYGPNPADPGVDTVFEIGNGGSWVVPAGTTELFLGTVDGYQWNNNEGAFTVTYSVPEPATWIALLVGFGVLGFALRGSRTEPRADATTT